MQSPENILAPQQAIPFAVYPDGTNSLGTAIDTLGYRYAVVLPVYASALSTATAVTVSVEDSTTSGGTYTAAEGASQALAVGQDVQAFGIVRVDGRERFLKLRVQVSGGNASMGAVVLLYGPNYDEQDGVAAYSA